MAVVVRSFAALALAVAPALAACSGAGNQDLFDPPAAGSDTSSTDPAPSGASTPGTSTGSNGAAGGAGAGPTAGAAGTSPPSKDPATPPDQPAACTPEVEPNNDLSKATPFTSSICGAIGSASDVDFVSFVVPKDVNVVRVLHTEKNGRAVYRYFLGGAGIGLQGDELEPVPGATYTIQVRLDKSNGSNGSLPSYEIDVAFH